MSLVSILPQAAATAAGCLFVWLLARPRIQMRLHPSGIAGEAYEWTLDLSLQWPKLAPGNRRLPRLTSRKLHCALAFYLWSAR